MKKFIVIGLGGIGSSLIDPLTRYLAYSYSDSCSIILVDGDEYDPSNMSRQSCMERDLGVSKAQATSNRIREIAPNIPIMVVPQFVTEANITTIIRPKSIVFLCVDNHEARALVSAHCDTLKDVVLISGGNEFSDGNAQIFIRKNDERLTAALDEYHPEISEPVIVEEPEPGCQVMHAVAPQLIFANFFAAASMLGLFYHYLSSLKNNEIERLGEIFFDLEKAAVLSYARPSLRSLSADIEPVS
jgi:molybdopterin/thiamine biosynthesis adenylyltransferase